jgi:ribosomal protein S20
MKIKEIRLETLKNRFRKTSLKTITKENIKTLNKENKSKALVK